MKMYVDMYKSNLYERNCIPAFGFEWEGRADNLCSCDHELECSADIAEGIKIGSKNIPQHIVNNIMKVLGYLPLGGGQVAGIYHIRQGCEGLKYRCTVFSGAGLIVRGILEFVGLGCVFIPIDVAKLGADGINALYQLYQSYQAKKAVITGDANYVENSNNADKPIIDYFDSSEAD